MTYSWPTRCYLARFHMSWAGAPPLDGAGLVYLNSSAVTVNGRFCSVPSQLGYELRSI